MKNIYKKIHSNLKYSTAPIKKSLRNPFNGGNRKLIVHCSHHKAGTRWFSRILRSIASHYGLIYSNSIEDLPEKKIDVLMQNRSRIDLSLLANYRAVHVIRDPRDMIISGYYYHLWTKESWANIPMAKLPDSAKRKWSQLPLDEFGDLTYQQYLNKLTEEEGILAEMKRTPVISEMHNWDYENTKCLEVKYEDLIENEKKQFHNVFEHYGFKKDAINRALKFVDQYSFKNRSGRKLGQTNKKSHFRSGLPQQWKKTFSDNHKVYFKERYGDTLVKLGYEESMNW